jgi:hypothetical protein
MDLVPVHQGQFCRFLSQERSQLPVKNRLGLIQNKHKTGVSGHPHLTLSFQKFIFYKNDINMTGSTIMTTCSFEDLKATIREVMMECNTNLKPAPENRLMTRKEACAFLHCGPTKLSNCTRDGVIQGRRIGKRVLYLESDLRAALSEMPNRQKWKKARMEDEDDDSNQ